jgi:hypothetical protein
MESTDGASSPQQQGSVWQEPVEWQDLPLPEKSPVLNLHRMRRSMIPQGRTTVATMLQKAKLRNWFNNVACSNVCFDVKNRNIRSSRCSCLMQVAMAIEGDGIKAVVDYLYEFALLELEEQKGLLKEWIKYAESSAMMLKRADRRQVYMLPGQSFLICKDALCTLLGMGHEKWSNCLKLARLNLPPTHGLKGKSSNRRNIEMETVLATFFDKQLEMALPRATMIVRDFVRGEVQLELRDEDVELRELPSHFTKKGMFNQMVRELGWKYNYDKKGRIIERLAIEGMEQEEKVPSWFMFFNYWKKYYPKLVVAAAREDVYNQCFVYANQHKYFANRLKHKETQEEARQEIADDEVEDEDNIPPLDDNDEEDEDGLLKKMLDSETLVKKAARHVEMAQLQRAMYQRKKRESIETKQERPSERVVCYVATISKRVEEIGCCERSFVVVNPSRILRRILPFAACKSSIIYRSYRR